MSDPQPAAPATATPGQAATGQALFTRCWQGVHASTAERLPTQLWRAMTDHDRSLWGRATFELGLLDKVITAHRAQIASLEDERDEARERIAAALKLASEATPGLTAACTCYDCEAWGNGDPGYEDYTPHPGRVMAWKLDPAAIRKALEG